MGCGLSCGDAYPGRLLSFLALSSSDYYPCCSSVCMTDCGASCCLEAGSHFSCTAHWTLCSHGRGLSLGSFQRSLRIFSCSLLAEAFSDCLNHLYGSHVESYHLSFGGEAQYIGSCFQWTLAYSLATRVCLTSGGCACLSAQLSCSMCSSLSVFAGSGLF